MTVSPHGYCKCLSPHFSLFSVYLPSITKLCQLHWCISLLFCFSVSSPYPEPHCSLPKITPLAQSLGLALQPLALLIHDKHHSKINIPKAYLDIKKKPSDRWLLPTRVTCFLVYSRLQCIKTPSPIKKM